MIKWHLRDDNIPAIAQLAEHVTVESLWQKSDGPWFDSGWPDMLLSTVEMLVQNSYKIFKNAFWRKQNRRTSFCVARAFDVSGGASKTADIENINLFSS